MNKIKTERKQSLFDLHLEYSEIASKQEAEYRSLENRFQIVFGYFPVRIEDDVFSVLTMNQQNACHAFWGNRRVLEARRTMLSARTLAAAYFNSFVDVNKNK